MIRRIWMVATRDFVTTVSSKGFLIGLLIMPLLILLFVLLAPRILNSRSPQVHGEVAVIDPTGQVLPDLREALDPDVLAARRAESRRRAAGSSGQAPQQMGAPVPVLTIVERYSGADLQDAKDWLIQADGAASNHLALIVIHPDAVVRSEGKAAFGSYDLYISKTLNDATENVIHDGVRRALVASRLHNSGLDQGLVEAAMRVDRPTSVMVEAAGERASQRGLARALPFICGLLLFMGVITGGQTLMTSTVEEKSSRVVEVLLAAVSPLELMWGKLLGQLAVGLLIMSIYLGLGVLSLLQFSLVGLLDPMLVVYLILFYLITYLVFGALMLAIGAAVNQAADAQSMMGPVMVLLITPYILAPIIGQAPNSTFSVAVSFIPPVNTFAMLARLASGTPPPTWQVWLTMLVGLAAAAVAVWFAAKVFRIGLLMHGKPPSFATLIRWARMA
ncbi:MAG: ABC transporter permease [Steroidobacteraceae bacterium]|nr:ABC transporter permease [Steroidobacteraceae bacterium]